MDGVEWDMAVGQAIRYIGKKTAKSGTATGVLAQEQSCTSKD